MKILFTSDVNFYYYDDYKGPVLSAEEVLHEAEPYFRRADFSVLNMESVFGAPEDHQRIKKAGPNIISRKKFLPYVEYLHPTVLNFANNHCGDYGDEPLFETLEHFSGEGYLITGAGKNIDEAYKPAVLEKDGVKVAVIGVNENEYGVAAEDRAGGAGYSLGRVTKAIFAARARGELPVIFFHGGNEFNPMPSPGKVELYRHFVDIGAAAVIAMHTHCPQPYEIYRGAPIVYSMGNFFFPKEKGAGYPPPENFKRSWFYGYMAELDIEADGIELSVIPYTFDFTSFTVLKGEELERFEQYMAYQKEVLADERKLREYFDSWCLKSGGPDFLYVLRHFFSHDGEDLERRALYNVKSNFCTEAFVEMAANTCNILYEKRFEEAKSLCEAIKTLQNMELPE